MSTEASFGPRQAYTQADLVNNQFSQTAATDGFVMATLGTVGYKSQFLGLVSGTTSLNEQVTSTVIAGATTQTLTGNVGKKGTQTFFVPLPGSFTMPVRAGETWTVTLTADAAFSPVPDLIFYWIPDGTTTSATVSTNSSATAAVYKSLHDLVMAGRS